MGDATPKLSLLAWLGWGALPLPTWAVRPKVDLKEREMNKLKVLGASVAMAMLVASPAAADTVRIGGFAAESEFLGNDSVRVGGLTVESQFLFFDNGVFGNNGFGNGFNNDFDDVFDDGDFDNDVFDD
jgi:hypothetical protein